MRKFDGATWEAYQVEGILYGYWEGKTTFTEAVCKLEAAREAMPIPLEIYTLQLRDLCELHISRTNRDEILADRQATLDNIQRMP